jgi:hypothetical protein
MSFTITTKKELIYKFIQVFMIQNADILHINLINLLAMSMNSRPKGLMTQSPSTRKR